MRTERWFLTRLCLWGLLCGLTLAVVQLLALAGFILNAPAVIALAPANPLAGTAVGGSGGIALLVVVGLVAGGFLWRRRVSH